VNKKESLEAIRAKDGFLIDMDGVLYHKNELLPGAAEFVNFLKENNKEFLFLTNSSERSPAEVQGKLQRMGITVDSEQIYTSALATASFVQSQLPAGGSAYVLGEPGLISALYHHGFMMNDWNPDFVIVGETSHYSYDRLERAINLVRRGARLIGTNRDLVDKVDYGFAPACGSLISPIEKASGRRAYFIGKPNPIMMRYAQAKMKTPRHATVIIGDRMDTDVIAGIEADISTCLVLTGVTQFEDLQLFPYQPMHILSNVGMIAGQELTEELTDVKKKLDQKPLTEPCSRLPPSQFESSVYSTME